MQLGSEAIITIAGRISFLKFFEGEYPRATFQLSKKQYNGKSKETTYVNVDCTTFSKRDIQALADFNVSDGAVMQVSGVFSQEEHKGKIYNKVAASSLCLLKDADTDKPKTKAKAKEEDDDNPFG